MNANFFGPGVGLVGIIDAEGQCTLTAEGDKICGPIRGTKSEAMKLAKALFRTTGPEGSLPSNHMSFWSADGTRLIVANLGAKLLERIDYDRETDTFTFKGDETYEDRFDLDGNGTIDISDFLIFVNDFGKASPDI